MDRPRPAGEWRADSRGGVKVEARFGNTAAGAGSEMKSSASSKIMHCPLPYIRSHYKKVLE